MNTQKPLLNQLNKKSDTHVTNELLDQLRNQSFHQVTNQLYLQISNQLAIRQHRHIYESTKSTAQSITRVTHHLHEHKKTIK